MATSYRPQYYTLRRIPLCGGYDSNGTYYGVGQKLWEAEIYADAIPGEGHGIGRYQGLETINFRVSSAKEAHAFIRSVHAGIKYRP